MKYPGPGALLDELQERVSQRSLRSSNERVATSRETKLQDASSSTAALIQPSAAQMLKAMPKNTEGAPKAVHSCRQHWWQLGSHASFRL